MKIGLMGCEFSSPNKGCEALSYSIVYILSEIKKIKQDLIIYNFSGTELGLIQKEFEDVKFENINPKIKDMKCNYMKKIHECDCILDATMGDSFSDIYSKDYFKHLMRHKMLAEMLNKNYILLPQTYGPFYNEKSKKEAFKVLKKSSKIYCRDKLSKDFLEEEFHIFGSELVTDMAFFLPYYKERYKFQSNKIKIGINVSGLLYRGGFSSNNQFNLKIDYNQYITKIIEYYSKIKNVEIHIIPHVIDLSENAHDDDYKICELINEKFPNCFLAPAFKNPVDAKSYISNMDIFIGSRMHSTIAAFSSGVITIPVSYSRKFEGLFNNLNYKYVINGKIESTNSAVKKTIEYINNKDKLKEEQKQAYKIIEEKKNAFRSSLEKVINLINS